EPLTLLIKDSRSRTTAPETFSNQLQRLRERFQEIYDVDFFQSSRGDDLERLFRKAEALQSNKGEVPQKEPLRAEDYHGRTWITRPPPDIDRVGTAWLIRNFIDPEAEFIFANALEKHQRALRYDMTESEFSHQGNCCTMETLIQRFRIRERAVLGLAEIVHDA